MRLPFIASIKKLFTTKRTGPTEDTYTAEETRLILHGTDDDWVRYIRTTLRHRVPKLEPYIAKYPLAAAYYALYALRRRWKGAESVIALNPRAAAFYAIEVMHHRWKKAEPVIAQDKSEALKYGIWFGGWRLGVGYFL